MQDHKLNRLIGGPAKLTPVKQPKPIKLIKPSPSKSNSKSRDSHNHNRRISLQSPQSPSNCQKCISRHQFSESFLRQRSKSRQSSKKRLHERSISKSRRRQSMTSLERLKHKQNPIHNVSRESPNKKSPKEIKNEESNRYRDQNQNSRPSINRKCLDLIRKKRELEERQRRRLQAALKVQAAWRGYRERKRLETEYQRLLEEEEAFQEGYRGSIIDKVRDFNEGNDGAEEEEEEEEGDVPRETTPPEDSPHQTQEIKQKLQRQLEEVISLKQQLRTQMQDVNRLRQRLEKKDRDRQEYYRNYTLKYQQQHRQKLTEQQNQHHNQVKIEQSQNQQEQYQRKTKIKRKVMKMLQAIISQRISKQNQDPDESLLTNKKSIQNYIDNLIEHLVRFYNRECQININKMFGFSYQRRLALLHQDLQEETINSYSGEILHFVVPQHIFQQLQDLLYPQHQGKHHRKALFDSFNESLTTLRPFYRQSSQPYPWSPTPLTHPSIPFRQSSSKAKKLLLHSISILCGLITNLDPNVQNQLALQNREWNLTVFEDREERALERLLQLWIVEGPDWQYREDERTEIGIEVSDWVLEEMLMEFGKWAVKVREIRRIIL